MAETAERLCRNRIDVRLGEATFDDLDAWTTTICASQPPEDIPRWVLRQLQQVIDLRHNVAASLALVRHQRSEESLRADSTHGYAISRLRTVLALLTRAAGIREVQRRPRSAPPDPARGRGSRDGKVGDENMFGILDVERTGDETP